MSCPHSSRSGPCSSCAGAPAQVVEIHDGIVTVDGQPKRASDPGAATPYTRMQGKRQQPKR